MAVVSKLEPEEVEAKNKRLIYLSVLVFLLYVGLTAWRYESTDRLKTNLESGDTIVGSETLQLFTTPALLEANYGVVCGVALMTLLFAVVGVYQKSKELVQFLRCCSCCCTLATAAFIITTFVVGPLCEAGEDCSDNITRQAGLILLLSAIFLLYGYIFYLSLRLYRTPEFFVDPSSLQGSFVLTNNEPRKPLQVTGSQTAAIPFAVAVEE